MQIMHFGSEKFNSIYKRRRNSRHVLMIIAFIICVYKENVSNFILYPNLSNFDMKNNADGFFSP